MRVVVLPRRLHVRWQVSLACAELIRARWVAVAPQSWNVIRLEQC